MICSIIYMELVMYLDIEDYEIILGRILKKSKEIYPVDFGYVDEALVHRGVGITYYGESKKKKIKLIVYSPSLVIGNDADEIWAPTLSNIMRLIENLEKRVEKYFQADYGLHNFDLARIDFAVDIDVGSRENVFNYIKVLHNIRQVKRFSPIKYGKRDGEEKDTCFGLVGNSNGVEFRVHGLKHEKRLLRAEVRLVKKATIKEYTNEYDTAEQIRDLAERSEPIFMNTFRYIIPPGDFYKKGKAEKLIWEKVSDFKMKHKMLRLLALTPEKKSLLLAQKSMDYRKIPRIMEAFAEIDLSPITISKRHDVKMLNSLYSYLD